MLLKTQLADKLQQIPSQPGIYFFYAKSRYTNNEKSKILYIGKSMNLHARLKSYFHLKDTKTSLGRPTSKFKTLALLKEAWSFSWKVLGSEAEALIKESELIKKYSPKYNVLMRDDKQYFYVGFTKEKYPKIFTTHQPRKPFDHSIIDNEREGAIFIGPFTEGGSLRSVLKILRRAFPYCTCMPNKVLVRTSKDLHNRPCINAKIGKCFGFCCFRNSKNMISGFVNFAAFSAWSTSKTKNQKLKQSSKFRSSETGIDKMVASDFLEEVYNSNIRAIKQILSGKNRTLIRQLKKEMGLLSSEQKYEEAGKLRDQIYALSRIFEHRGMINKDMLSENNRAIKQLETLLKITEIERIEAYDIANLHGKFAYGGMAVFTDGDLKKNDYRLFKINTVTKSDDPKMIAEIILRRLKHLEWHFPQVIIVDGGKTQLSVAIRARNLANEISRYGRADANANTLKIKSVKAIRQSHVLNFSPKIIALAKNKRHVGDHIFIERVKNPIPLSSLPESLKNLILLLDAEAHRFAISRYRKSHRKNLFSDIYPVQ